MKVYFTAANTGAIDQKLDTYRLIVKSIKDLGHEMTNYYFMGDSDSLKAKTYKKLEAREESIYTVSIKGIQDSSCVIADITKPSVTVGMHIEYAITNRIPVLCLYDEKDKDNLPLFIRDYQSTFLTRTTYTSENIKPIIKRYIDEVKKMKVRFNFFINYDIDRYLSYIADSKNKSKAEVVRKILEEYIEKTPEVKNALEDTNSFDQYRPIPSKTI